ncbi:ATP-binding protein [Oscillibacter sp. GMB15532]|uniref:ATP-binding protein n=1 Tax=Oscillibacter sp. GMB15532 TaxID=3230022 RepID=UPI0034DDEBD3
MGSTVHIIVGHYGSGKTEFAVNYAINLKRNGADVALADLDIVNPYFRTRQQADMLGARGINVVSSNLGNDWKIDIPALSGALQSFFIESGRENVIDVGGNAVGARVLARFRDEIIEGHYDMWMVVNANRFESQTAEQAISFAESIMQTSGLHITGAINNTHMLRETTIEDILHGSKVTEEVCRRMNIPCIYTVCPQFLLEACKQKKGQIVGELFPIEMFMRPQYL